MNLKKLLRPLLLLVLVNLAACSTGANTKQDDSLYQALGQRDGIAQMVQAIFVRVYGDQRISALFKEVDRKDLERLVSEQICFEAGGPCPYTGRSMEESHAGLALTHKDFDAFVEDFILGMEDHKVSYSTQNRVLKIFAPMRVQIIDK